MIEYPRPGTRAWGCLYAGMNESRQNRRQCGGDFLLVGGRGESALLVGVGEEAALHQNTRMGSLLQGIFLTQESNQGLLHCRQNLYQLSYQESPRNK